MIRGRSVKVETNARHEGANGFAPLRCQQDDRLRESVRGVEKFGDNFPCYIRLISGSFLAG
jgi:hypothetical protein